MIQLPIDPYLDQIVEKILSPSPLILTASPGSGKTTRVPAALLKQLQQKNITQKIVVIVPKRIAAVGAADRIAVENNWTLGEDVGYQVRFEKLCRNNTQLIFMTEGLFLKKASDHAFWDTIGYILLDEFHERTASIDLILGLCFERRILLSHLQIVVMSATLNVEKLKSYFGDSSHIQIEQRPHKLNIYFQKTAQKLICDSSFYDNLKNTTLEATKISKKDILIFLPGTREILKAQSVLSPVLPAMKIEIVTGSMNLAQQKKILNKTESYRRIILATNVAESSLTIPETDCVIDSGLEKIVVREKKMGFSKLETVRISQFSSTQRAGRAARTSDGYCFKMWHEIDERSLPEQKKPQILSSELYDELLLLSNLGVTDFLNFSWLDRPTMNKLNSATQQLKKWHLLNEKNEMLPSGASLAQIPMDLMQSILFQKLCEQGFTNEACEIFCKLESIDFSSRPKFNPLSQTSDLDYIFAIEKSDSQKRIFSQLKEFFPMSLALQNKDLALTLLEIFTEFFPDRICIKKSKMIGLSSSGRGVEFSDSSALQSDTLPHDYFIALSGIEKNASTTLVNLGIGYSKKQALEVLKQHLTSEHKIDFKSDSHKFMKKTVQKFGEFIFNESSPETLSKSELDLNWKNYVQRDSTLFLKLNPSFEKLTEKIQFLFRKSDLIKTQTSDFDFIEEFPQLLVSELTTYLDSFEDFLHADFNFHLQNLLPVHIQNLLRDLPNNLILPTGRSVTINYTDPKAPLISAKIQDCFSWHKSPTLLNELIPVTIELLAPNMRPAQITNDLNNFWQNSYKDVRKDLRARYPKHSWPEDVLNFHKT
jgi:ATP-dependent helicase HrpB